MTPISHYNKYGFFEYYADYASTIYAFKPAFNNFKKILINHNLLNMLK